MDCSLDFSIENRGRCVKSQVTRARQHKRLTTAVCGQLSR